MKLLKKLINFKEIIFFTTILIIAFLLLVGNINDPFQGHHEFNGVFYSNIARNYLRYGLLKTRFSEVTNYGIVNSKDFSFHTHHPPLFPLLLALFYKMFGFQEWAARLLPIISSLFFLFVFYLLLKNIYKISQSYLIILLGILTPMFLYYARLPVYEPVVMPFILLTIYYYLLWQVKTKKKYFILIAVNLFISQLIAWPAYYLSLILFFHQLLFSYKKEKRFLGFSWLIIACFSFAIIVMRNYIATGFLWKGLNDIFRTRLTGVGGGQPFTLWQFIRLELARLRAFFTTPLLILAFYWLINFLLMVIRKKKISFQENFVPFFLIFGLLHIIIFPNIAWYHDYMFYYFLPPLVLAAALGFREIATFLGKYKLLVLVTILLLIFLEKKQFLHDLKNLKPHAICVKWGNEIKNKIRKPIIETTNEEDSKICPPFTNFYADQEAIFKVIN